MIEKTAPKTFDQFWQAYPRKAKKQDAIKAWRQVKADELIEVIMTSLAQFISSPEWSKENGRFIPYPASWICGRRWEDETIGENKEVNNASIGEKRKYGHYI